MILRTALLISLAVVSLLHAASQTTIERECVVYRSEFAFDTVAGHYVIGSISCAEWGGLYSRSR